LFSTSSVFWNLLTRYPTLTFWMMPSWTFRKTWSASGRPRPSRTARWRCRLAVGLRGAGDDDAHHAAQVVVVVGVQERRAAVQPLQADVLRVHRQLFVEPIEEAAEHLGARRPRDVDGPRFKVDAARVEGRAQRQWREIARSDLVRRRGGHAVRTNRCHVLQTHGRVRGNFTK
jgi:hypothetical protein